MPDWIIFCLVTLALILYLVGRSARVRTGFSPGRTLDLDSRTLYSARYGLAGRPDRIVKQGGLSIPEEWKTSPRVYDSHRAQMGVYFLLIEEDTGLRPTHGFIVTGDGRRHRIENTPEIRAWVLGIADQIRMARRQTSAPIQVRQPPAKCRSCGMREHCGQRRDR